MKFDFKNRGFVVITLSAMLIAVGVINYQLSKQSALTVSKNLKHMNKLNKIKIQIKIQIRIAILVIMIKIQIINQKLHK